MRFGWFGRQPVSRRKAPWLSFRPTFEELEDRRLLAAPVINPVQVPLNIPANKTLFVPVTATDPGNGSVSITMTPATGTTGVTVTPHTGDPFLQMAISINGQAVGNLEFQLFQDLTPQTVAYITGLVKSGFYNNLQFFRSTHDATLTIIQGGSPTNTNTGGPPGANATQAQQQALEFPDEFTPTDIFSGTGQLAMANSGNDTNGSQFFVTLNSTRFLDFNHTIFGQLVRGFDVLNQISAVPTDSNDKPTEPIVITSAQIVNDPSAAVFTVQSTSATTGSVSFTVTATPSTAGETPATTTLTGNVVADTTNDPPFLTQINGVAVNNFSSLTVAQNGTTNVTLTATDLESDTPTFTLTSSDTTDIQITPGTVTGSAGNFSETFSVTALNGFRGQATLTGGVTESGSTRNNGPDTQKFALAVGDQQITFTPANPATPSATEGSSTAFTLGTLADPDTNAAAGDFTVNINWGDGTALDTGTLTPVSGTPGSFTVKGTHTYAEVGKYTAQVTITDHPAATTAVTDLGGSVAMGMVTVPVTTDAALSSTGIAVTATQGVVFSGPVATFTDAAITGTPTAAQAGEYTATINWGDNTSSSGIISVVGSSFQVSGSHTYATPGHFTVTTNITDAAPATDGVTPSTTSAQSTATVAAAPVTSSSSATTAAAPMGPFVPLTANERFLRQAFLDLFGHLPSDIQLATLGAKLDQGSSRSQMVRALAESPDHHIKEITDLYGSYLGTQPTQAQLQQGLAFLNHHTIGELRTQLLGSNDYLLRHGNTTAGFLAGLAQDVLHHAMSTAEQTKLAGLLAQGMSRAQVAATFLRDPEAVAAGIQDLYQGYLQRSATTTEVNDTVSSLGHGMTDDEIAAALVASTEFFRKSQTASS